MNAHKKRKAPSRQQRYSPQLKYAIARQDRHAIRAIGERLFALGGVKLMLDVCYGVAGRDHRIIGMLSSAWDGIGGKWWR